MLFQLTTSTKPLTISATVSAATLARPTMAGSLAEHFCHDAQAEAKAGTAPSVPHLLR